MPVHPAKVVPLEAVDLVVLRKWAAAEAAELDYTAQVHQVLVACELILLMKKPIPVVAAAMVRPEALAWRFMVEAVEVLGVDTGVAKVMVVMVLKLAELAVQVL